LSEFCDAGPHLVLPMMQHNFGAAGDLLLLGSSFCSSHSFDSPPF